jgi:CubicO group peptidase (beta-lactamase class C family)
VERYVPELAGTLHGGATLRNLANMSSGADVVRR